jgi:hypothetical protein
MVETPAEVAAMLSPDDADDGAIGDADDVAVEVPAERGGTGFPDSWRNGPLPEHLAIALEHGLRTMAAYREFDTFKADAIASKRRERDWPAAWRAHCAAAD